MCPSQLFSLCKNPRMKCSISWMFGSIYLKPLEYGVFLLLIVFILQLMDCSRLALSFSLFCSVLHLQAAICFSESAAVFLDWLWTSSDLLVTSVTVFFSHSVSHRSFKKNESYLFQYTILVALISFVCFCILWISILITFSLLLLWLFNKLYYGSVFWISLFILKSKHFML